jgi:hypothetical protein
MNAFVIFRRRGVSQQLCFCGLSFRIYYVYNIEYIDVTPYNFVEVEGRVWIIDFGHAMKRQAGRKTNWYLRDIFDEGKISYWNPDFK